MYNPGKLVADSGFWSRRESVLKKTGYETIKRPGGRSRRSCTPEVPPSPSSSFYISHIGSRAPLLEWQLLPQHGDRTVTRHHNRCGGDFTLWKYKHTAAGVATTQNKGAREKLRIVLHLHDHESQASRLQGSPLFSFTSWLSPDVIHTDALQQPLLFSNSFYSESIACKGTLAVPLQSTQVVTETCRNSLIDTRNLTDASHLPTYHQTYISQRNILNLPIEILLMILGLLPILDLVSVFQVCKLFEHLLSDDLFWRSLYRQTPLLRPPGPFRSQSTGFLRNALVSSSRVARNWPRTTFSPTPRVTNTFSIFHGFKFSKLLAGRWLTAGDSQLIWCYDLHNPIPRVFYQPHLVANFFQCVSTTNDKGELVAFAVSETQVGNSRRGINIYKVTIDHNGPVITSRILRDDVPDNYPGVSEVTIGPRFLVVIPRGPNFVQTQPIVLDINTLQQYHVPRVPFPGKVMPQVPHVSHMSTFVSTTSYLLALYSFLTDSKAPHTLVLAFPLGPRRSSGHSTVTSILQESHHTWIENLGLTNVAVLREDPVNPRSKTTRITLFGKRCVCGSRSKQSLTALKLTLDEMGTMLHEYANVAQVDVKDHLWLDTGPDGYARAQGRHRAVLSAR
ncbi:hypothetical protein BU15DRAFT_64338 [Melanogaster broomeanus]|nr:hypothetical protein BU15DRAFT_64338 [Melanogaster broomeanus]